jgi:hypothetical protein
MRLALLRLLKLVQVATVIAIVLFAVEWWRRHNDPCVARIDKLAAADRNMRGSRDPTVYEDMVGQWNAAQIAGCDVSNFSEDARHATQIAVDLERIRAENEAAKRRLSE